MKTPPRRLQRSMPPVLLMMLLAAAAVASPDGAPRTDAAQRLARHLTESSDLMTDDLGFLCDRIGGRPTGSAACRRAILWGKERFEAAGAIARLEPFTMPRLWVAGEIDVRVVSPETMTIDAAAVPFSPATTAPIETHLFDAGTGRPDDFTKAGARARGGIGLVRTDPMESLEDLFAEYIRNNSMLEAAERSGAAALLLMSTRPRSLLYRHPVLLDGRLAPMPIALASREPALRLGRLLDSGEEIRLRLSAGAETSGPYESHNVVAEIRGREKPREVVLIGAHLDSWDLGTGAEDNGVNCSILIALARALNETSLTPRRTIRFVLFTGEEQGLHGSAAYVRAHASEMDDHVAAIILDTGSGRIEGFYLNGREQLRAPVKAALEAASHLGPFEHPSLAINGTDNFDFLLSGVPNLVAAQDAAPYLPDYHAESDVFEAVDLDQAVRNAVVTAALMWDLAERIERPGARQTREEVESLIERSGLEPQMRAFGQWEGWVSGERGALPR